MALANNTTRARGKRQSEGEYKDDNRDNIPLESTSSSGKEYYYQQLKQLYLTTCFASNNTARARGKGGGKAGGATFAKC